MNFQAAKDEFLKWAVPTLLAALIWQVSELSKDMVGQQTTVAFQTTRLDRQKDLIDSVTNKVVDHGNRLVRLETIGEAKWKH